MEKNKSYFDQTMLPYLFLKAVIIIRRKKTLGISNRSNIYKKEEIFVVDKTY